MTAVFSHGPTINLNEREMNLLKARGYGDFYFADINGILRISIVNIFGRKNLQGKMCEPGVNVRRYPENISSYDYKGKQLWVIRLSKQKFEEFLHSESENGIKNLDSRCKYDRIHIGYFEG